MESNEQKPISADQPDWDVQVSFDGPDPVSEPVIDPSDSDWSSYTNKQQQRTDDFHPAMTALRNLPPEPVEEPDEWVDAAQLGVSVWNDVPVVSNAPDSAPVPQQPLSEQIVESIKKPLYESPVGRSVVGGFGDAVNGLIDTANEIGQYFTGESYIPFNLPTVPEGDAVAEGLARDITQFMTGFASAGGMAMKGIAKMTAAGAAGDVTFDPTEGNFSTFLRELDIDNSVTQFLDSTNYDDEDNLRARLANVAEGALMGASIDLIVESLRWAKNNPEVTREALLKVLNKTTEIGTGGVVKEMPLARYAVDDQSIDSIMTGSAQQSSEALPSTGLLEGRMLKRHPIEVQEQYQLEVNDLTDGRIEEITGLQRIGTATAPSRFEGHIGASQQITYKVETELDADGFIVPTAEYREKLKRAAAVKGYIQDQDAVVNSFLAPVKDPSDVNAVSFNIGRVLTHDEMMSVDAAIDEVAKSLGVNPDDIATPTTKDGINLLNVSFGGIDALQFNAVADKILDVLGVTEYDFANNTLLDDGYIGGFDGYKTGQKAYDSISKGPSNDTGTSNGTQQWWGHSDRVEQAREEVRTHREKFLKKHKLPRKTIRQIGDESDELARKERRVIKANDFSKKAHNAITPQMFDEAVTILKGGDKDATGWYTTRFQMALDTLSKKHPELAPGKDQTARDLYTTFVAITSDGAKVAKNLEFADEAYSSYKKTGKVNAEIPGAGERAESYKINLDILQRLIDEQGVERATKYLAEHQTVSKIEASFGVKAGGFSKSSTLPNAAVFGPKLGMFWANLIGQPEHLTMDRWWSRTFHRYRGKMTKDPTKQSIATLKKLLIEGGLVKSKNPQMKTITSMAKDIAKRYGKEKNFKNGTPLDKAANNVAKAVTGLIDSPAGVTDRSFQVGVTRDVVEVLQIARPGESYKDAKKRILDHRKKQKDSKEPIEPLKKEGFAEMTPSDLQAILWYGEKRRMKEFGSASPIDEVDFMDVTSNIIKEDN